MPKELVDNSLAPCSFSVSADSSIEEHFEAAIDLWKVNRATLGLFPRGAFEDHARKNLILYLLDRSEVKGYLLYRVARQRVAISHLCVSGEIRGKGGARILFEALRQHADDGHCKGIEVRCRSDYEISRMWPSLGFEHAGHMQGKAKGGSELTIWYFKFDIPDFFYEMMPRHDDDSLTWAVIDANIVFKMSDPEKAENEEALALISDAMTPYVRYFVTPEIFVETERKKNPKEKKSVILRQKSLKKLK
ncbi:GNAT family N-acetyltransferase [Oceanicoccus sp. KOV_DT_Chl]|uniref:GNAT family N-acetyltransferase n=1 Tax=Oceanicoccus sp. KOV_DT_Chl TaxID=1904639 RepID=UPI0013576059|nr:GNAT family N-acetyltransferase [Oceanicoccus sp. KOV_DT_Chl]